ncbi:TPA: phage major capsid protein, partial [Klebsiella pneumoniae]
MEKAIENSQKEVKELIEEQRKSINQTGEINKQLQIDLTKAQEELKATGTRLFDLEQKLAGNSPDQTAQKSFAQRVSEDLMKGWDGSRTKAKVISFDKAIGSGAASAGALVQPQQLPGILMP